MLIVTSLKADKPLDEHELKCLSDTGFKYGGNIENKNTRLSLFVRLALLNALDKAAELDGDIADLITYPLMFEENEFGKPFFAKEHPLYNKLYFSLSHSGDLSVCALSDAAVGADVEFIRDKLPTHAKKMLSDDEKITFDVLSDEEKKRFFFESWVRKESYLKCIGTGLKIYPSKLSIDEKGVVSGPYDIKLKTDLIDCEEGYICSVCRE